MTNDHGGSKTLRTGGRATQADVARRAGVSQALVSYILNGQVASATPATRQRILRAIDELGYVPHGAAQSLRTRRTMTIALIVPDITNPFYPEVQRGVQEIADLNGYQVMTFNTDNSGARLSQFCITLLRTGADGAVICDLHELSPEVRRLVAAGTAVTFLGQGDPQAMPLDEVSFDSFAASRLAAEYLVGRHFLTFGTIAGPTDTTVGRDRLNGFLSGLAAAGHARDDTSVVYSDFTLEGGRDAMTHMLAARPTTPRAIFAANDVMALGALQVIRERGLNVPGDVALIGLDDIAAASMVTPRLTTIAQPQRTIGRRAAELVISRIATDIDLPARSEGIPYSLIVRESA